MAGVVLFIHVIPVMDNFFVVDGDHRCPGPHVLPLRHLFHVHMETVHEKENLFLYFDVFRNH